MRNAKGEKWKVKELRHHYVAFHDLEFILKGRKRKAEGEQLAMTHIEFSLSEAHNGMQYAEV